MCFRHIWCLDFKGGLFCSTLPETGLTWQRFEDNVHQVALSPSGELLKSHRIDECCVIPTAKKMCLVSCESGLQRSGVQMYKYVALAGC